MGAASSMSISSSNFQPRGRSGYVADPKLAFPHSSSFAGQGSSKAFTKAEAASTSQSSNSLRTAAADSSAKKDTTTKTTATTSAAAAAVTTSQSVASFKAVKSSDAKTKPATAP